MIKLFLDTNININVLDENKRSPLHIACQYNTFEGAQYLVEHGAHVCDKTENKKYPLDICMEFQDKHAIIYVLNKHYHFMLSIMHDEEVEDEDSDDEFYKLFGYQEEKSIFDNIFAYTKLLEKNNKLSKSEKYIILTAYMRLNNEYMEKTLTRDIINSICVL